jgi:tRNA (cmo5U34)-methyltransferase
MARVHAALAPGGVFVNAEQVDGPTPELTALYAQRWAQDCRALGATEAELDAARERMRHDRCTDAETQLAWLRDAGFAAADCTYRSWRFAVLIARKEGS